MFSLMMDSSTRFAMAQREIGLSVGGTAGGKRIYAPSIYSGATETFRESGNFEEWIHNRDLYGSGRGDDTNEPISDTVRGIIDGHIILSRKVAAKKPLSGYRHIKQCQQADE